MKRKVNCTWLFSILVGVVALALGGLAAAPARAQAPPITPPDLTVCDSVAACDAPRSVCDGSGFTVTLTNYTPAPSGDSGSASYTYTICAPASDGVCSNSTDSCQDNSSCWANRCQNGGLHVNTCSQDDVTACTTDKDCNTGVTCTGGASTCRADKFHGLSHVDVAFPAIGASCLSVGTIVTVACSSPGVNGGSPYDGVIGDGSCFEGDSPVAKCNEPNLAAGQCLTMTISIPGELNAPGLGAAILVDKESTSCTASCLAGPSCTPCELQEEDGGACLTRTIGFWGTHPWITNDYDPVTVCGKPLDCSGADDGESNPSCPAGSCTSIMEGLGSIPGELPGNQPYVTMVRQLTAAKLNLNATAALFEASCSSFRYQDKTIQEWIETCEGLCSANKATISNSGCIEALDTFNNSQDTGFDVTPAPFDQPSVDDFGNISGADPNGFVAAHGNKNPPGKWVIGKQTTGPAGHDCRQ